MKDCWHKDSGGEKESKGSETAAMIHQDLTVELLLATNDASILEDKTLWIADTAATVHTTPHQEIMLNVKAAESVIIIGNGAKEKTTLIDNVTGHLRHQKEGTTQTI